MGIGNSIKRRSSVTSHLFEKEYGLFSSGDISPKDKYHKAETANKCFLLCKKTCDELQLVKVSFVFVIELNKKIECMKDMGRSFLLKS